MNTDMLQEYCMSLPAAQEGVKWEDHLCFMIAEKMFCITGFTDDTNVSFKVTPEDFEVLTEREGIVQAKYFAKKQWVSISKRNALRNAEWKEYLKKSYNLVKEKLPKKVQKEIDDIQ